MKDAWKVPHPELRRKYPASARMLFDPGSRDLLPGAQGEIMTLEGETLKHTFLMGSDSFGRDIYSRVIYGAQVSLIIGIALGIGRVIGVEPVEEFPYVGHTVAVGVGIVGDGRGACGKPSPG